MAKRTHDMMAGLADVLSEGRRPPCDYFEKVIDATASHGRMLVGLYGLLATGAVFLLFQVEMSSWAGAAMVMAWVLFIVGLICASMHIVAYNKMLLLADAIDQGEEAVGFETGEEDASPEAFVRAEAMARRLHSSESNFLFLGLFCAGAAALIDHWQYAWRAFSVLGGVVVLLLVIGAVSGLIGNMTRRPGDATEDESDE